ncbi:NADH-quinone oxidoreductase subunit N [Panacibacter ginsenosidivorans]|uniref:NADH-quinone oxidoreductase subunit N n=2 Tax=Panacibacter ginsenosidivorans TaxID=1813871 RepID=A0A5B8VFB3_9BACT|nr:NADH-quinone oxidoreductase subunit N [Panacibacter ginsenosidivorans]
MNDFYILLKQELVITVLIFILLFIKVGSKEKSNESLLSIINILLLVNVIAGCLFSRDGSLFSKMFVTNDLIVLQKTILNFGTLLISMLAYPWLKNHKHVLEFYMLLLSTLLGMFFMISAGNLLMFYLGLELSTIPLAAIVNFDLNRRQSSEGAMKLIISSAFSSALLLFGISLLYGTTGSLDYFAIAQKLNGSVLQLFSFILLLAGFGFKISIVPFHLWTADVYEGSPGAVTAYLSVISKAAFVFVFTAVLYNVFKLYYASWYNMLYVLSILTMLVGNLFAIRQNNLKRFLAFSSIAQVGFILVGISGMSQVATTSVIYFMLIYIFSNLGAFAVVVLVSAATGKENISDYKAFYSNNKLLSWVLTISLFSLAGIPPTAGFFGKFFLLMAGAGKGNYVLVGIAAGNIVISFYYYLKVVKAIFMDANDQPIEKIAIPAISRTAMLICVSGTLLIGFISWIYDHIYSLSFGF